MSAPPERIEPNRTAVERAMLDQWLDYHRATLLMKCANCREGTHGGPAACHIRAKSHGRRRSGAATHGQAPACELHQSRLTHAVFV